MILSLLSALPKKLIKTHKICMVTQQRALCMCLSPEIMHNLDHLMKLCIISLPWLLFWGSHHGWIQPLFVGVICASSRGFLLKNEFFLVQVPTSLSLLLCGIIIVVLLRLGFRIEDLWRGGEIGAGERHFSLLAQPRFCS